MKPVISIVDELLEAGVNVTVYNGQLDLIVDTMGRSTPRARGGSQVRGWSWKGAGLGHVSLGAGDAEMPGGRPFPVMSTCPALDFFKEDRAVAP